MSLNAVTHTARQGNQSAMEITAIALDARCTPWYVPNAAKRLKCPSNLAVINRFTVMIATVKPELIHNALV